MTCRTPRTRGKTRVVQGCRQGSMSPVIKLTTSFFASHHQPSPHDSPHHRTRHPCSRLPATLTPSSERPTMAHAGCSPQSAGEGQFATWPSPLPSLKPAVCGGAESASCENIVGTATEGSRAGSPNLRVQSVPSTSLVPCLP